MEKLCKKEVKEVFGKKNYLIGERNGVKIWLEEASWDCGWYWGFGYIEEYNKRYTDINSHTYFSNYFCNSNCIEEFKKDFDKITLNDSELWKLFEYMKQFYIIREYSDLLCRSGANYTTVNNLQKFDKDNKKEYERINKIVLPNLFKHIENILKETEEED